MNKKVLAAAVVATLGGAVSAQNVTIYGILDASAVNTDNGPYSSTEVNSGYLVSSRLGIRGEEDLGGGLKALFKLEGRLGFDNFGGLGTSVAITNGTTATGQTSSIFNRDAYVGISGGFGEFALGTMESETSRIASAYNATGFNVGLFTAAYGSSFAVLGDRMANAIRYSTPSVMGLSAVFAGFQGENKTGTSSTLNGSSFNGAMASLRYEMGALKVGVAQANRSAANGVAANSQTTAGARAKDTTYGAMYDFGIAAVGLAKYNSAYTALANTGRSATMLTGSLPIDGKTRLFGSYGQLEEKAAGLQYSASNDTSSTKAKAYYIGVNHELSKRTSIYAVMGNMNNDTGSGFVLNTGATLYNAGSLYTGSGTNYTGQDQSNYAIGIRHSF